MKNLIFLVFVITVSITALAIDYVDQGSGLWNDANNWVGGMLPGDTDQVSFRTDGSWCHIQTGDILSGSRKIKIGDRYVTNHLSMSGGQLTINADGYQFGGLSIGYNTAGGLGNMFMYGGRIDILAGEGLIVGKIGDGNLYMTGGTINTNTMYVGKHNWQDGDGVVYLDGGTLWADQLFAGERGISDGTSFTITGGTLILTGDQRSIIEDYVTGRKYVTPSGDVLFPGDPNLNGNAAWMSASGSHLFYDYESGDPVPGGVRVSTYLATIDSQLVTVVQDIPEPATLLLFGLGGLVMNKKRKF